MTSERHDFRKEIKRYPVTERGVKPLSNGQRFVTGLFKFDIVKPVPVVGHLNRSLPIVDAVDPHFRVGRIACDRRCLADAPTQAKRKRHKKNSLTDSFYALQSTHELPHKFNALTARFTIGNLTATFQQIVRLTSYPTSSANSS